MTKKQKLWLWVFIALFVIPELLWSPVGNFVYSLYMPLRGGSAQILRDNFLLDNKYDNLYSSILFIQLLGIFLTALFLIYLYKHFKHKVWFWLGVVLLFLLAVLVFFLFGFSITLRNIGF